jgi:hypothetical protein
MIGAPLSLRSRDKAAFNPRLDGVLQEKKQVADAHAAAAACDIAAYREIRFKRHICGQGQTL